MDVGQEGDHTVIFWGYTGTGKSTTIKILSSKYIYGYLNKGTPSLTVFKSKD
jgi:replication-associated recombination protein RarA